MRVVQPGRGNSLVRVHHCNNSLFPTRNAMTVGRPRAEQRPPRPRAARSGIAERVIHNGAQRRPPAVRECPAARIRRATVPRTQPSVGP